MNDSDLMDSMTYWYREEYPNPDKFFTEMPKAYPTPMEMVSRYYEVSERNPHQELAADLIMEEYSEWLSENTMYFGCNDMYSPKNELKELADLVYVIYGYALSRGWNLDEAVLRVHKNNLQRMTQDDGTIQRRADGKIIKNPNAPKCDLSDLV